MNVRNFLAALLFVAVPAAAAIDASQTTTVIEFYNASLDHYFMTANPAEAADLDNGVHVGWKRTGLTFQAIQAGTSYPGSTPIGRFYGSPDAGLDSHFYTASAQETADVQSKFAGIWLLESPEVFRAMPVDPNTGKCPSDFEPIYRLYNKRSDVNHRYTDDLTVFQSMVAKGYVAEGNGNPQLPVIFCMPSKDTSVAPEGTPSCTLSATSTSPNLGTFITLTATCTNAPTQYNWTNCNSSANTCTIASATAGTATYSVIGTNATGSGNTAKLAVNWGSTGGPLPICTISASSTTPQTGSSVTLTANCSQSPTQYAWMSCNYLLQSACNFISTCASSSSTCTTTQSFAGFAHYALAATNGAGQGPRAGIDVEWSGNSTGGGGGGGGQSAPVCSLFASDSTPLVGTTITLTASCSGSVPTSYAWTNCTSTGPTCTTSSANAGNVTYTVHASNSLGSTAPSTTVAWALPGPPTCTLSASNTQPMAGTPITLTAHCSGSPTNYTWSGGAAGACSASSSTCSVSESTSGVQTYAVKGTNGAGTSVNPGTATVTWQPRPTAPPNCSVSANPTSPFTGQTLTLTATCDNSPTSYHWTNCSSTGATCSTTSFNAGTQSYSVNATNVVGTGSSASINVSWQQSTTTDFCSQYSNVGRVSEAWGGASMYPTGYGSNTYGHFAATEVLVIAVTVPSSQSSYGTPFFSSQISQYVDNPVFRYATLSRSPCDFRPLDRTGQNGPISIGAHGQTVTVQGNVGGNGPMLPGQTWYISIRNIDDIDTARNTCSPLAHCDVIIGWNWPR